MKNLKKTFQILFIALFFVPFFAFSQGTDMEQGLKGLRKMTDQELKEKSGQLKLKLNEITFYSPEGKKLEMIDLATYLNGNDYHKNFYVDEKQDVKAIAFSNLSDEEKKTSKEVNHRDINEIKKIEAAKPFVVTDINNKKYDLAKLKGKVVVINFWFSGCKLCIIEMPELNKITEKYAGKDVVFLAITYDKKDLVNSFLSKREFKYALVPNAKKVIDNYGVSAYPTHIIIDKNSNIIFKTAGLNTEETIYSIDKYIENSLK